MVFLDNTKIKKIGISVNPKRDIISPKEERKIHFSSIIGVRIPPKFRPAFKKIGNLLGMNFSTPN